MKVTFKQWECYAHGAYYPNDRMAIMLKEVGTNEPVATATVNLPDYDIPDETAFIKDYSENEGMVQSLIDADIIYPFLVGHAKSGYVDIPLYIITDEAIDKLFPKYV